MPNSGRIRITKNSHLTDPLIDPRGAPTKFISYTNEFQISEFGNESLVEYDFILNEWYLNLSSISNVKISDIIDVELTTLSDSDVLIYNNITQKWHNSDKLHIAIQNIESVENEISIINQLNIDQQNTIDSHTTQIDSHTTQIADIVTVNTTQQTEINEGSTLIGTLGGTVPEGGIVLYRKYANIPNNWILCNGANSTPNLSNTTPGMVYIMRKYGTINPIIYDEFGEEIRFYVSGSR